MLIELDRTNISEHVGAPGVSLVNWSSVNRTDSLLFDDVCEYVAAANPGIRFGSVDVVLEGELAKEWSVDEAPSVMVFRDGTLLFIHSGPLNAEALDALVRAAWSADMEEARSKTNGHRTRGLPAQAGHLAQPGSAVDGTGSGPSRKPA